MGRDPRVHIQEQPLMEFTNRVFQGCCLIDQDEFFQREVIGFLYLAKKLFPMKLHSGVIAGNHFHLKGSPEDVQQQADFLGYFTRLLSMAIKRRHPEWEGPVFPQRYKGMEVSAETEAQCARMHYFLSNMCKEGLVSSPLEWPGAPFAEALMNGGVLKGVVVDRDALYKARRRGEEVTEQDFAEEVELLLDPLPCFAHLTREEYEDAMKAMIRRVEKETAAMHAVDGTRSLGVEGVKIVDPMKRRKLERSPRPKVYAFEQDVREKLYEGLRLIITAYREAAEKLRDGHLKVRFPPNCFPSALPFVARDSAPSPLATLRDSLPNLLEDLREKAALDLVFEGGV